MFQFHNPKQIEDMSDEEKCESDKLYTQFEALAEDNESGTINMIGFRVCRNTDKQLVTSLSFSYELKTNEKML